MTVRDLKEMLSKITEDEVLDKEIKFCSEEDGWGNVCYSAWFDLQDFGIGPIENVIYPTVTVCVNERDYNEHSGRIPWTEFAGWLQEIREEEEEDF